jgi:hypothetical protein
MEAPSFIKRWLGISNQTKKQPSNADVWDRVFETTSLRVVQDIQSWRLGIQLAEDVFIPDRRELITTYKDVALDAHLTGLVRTLVMKVLSRKFVLKNIGSDEVNEKETEKLQKKFFKKILKEKIEAMFWGHSLIQLGDMVNDNFPELLLIKREYVIPDKHGVKRDLNTPTDLIDYTLPDVWDWVLEFGERDDLGLYNVCSPWAIWKKNTVNNWSRFSELFGSPIRIGKTQINNTKMRNNMREALANMGANYWMLTDIEDEFELHNSNSSDVSDVWEKLAEMGNREMSKAVLLQTGTTDEKSFVGSAEEHGKILDQLIQSILRDIESDMNDQVIPKFSRIGLLPSGLQFEYEESQKLSVEQTIKVVQFLLNTYSIDPEEIKETFGINVELKEDGSLNTSLPSIQNNLSFNKDKLRDMYNGFVKDNCCG